MAQACSPMSTKWRKVCCSRTGSGVVRPVATISAKLSGAPSSSPGRGARPMPKVPTSPHAMGATSFKFDSAWASHQALEVLPLVPVTASTANCRAGCSK